MRERRAGRDRRLRAAALAALAALAAMAAPHAPASAQGPGSVPPPPVRQAVDEQGVDVIRGEFSAAQPAISIGPAYPHGLVYSSVNAGSGWFNGANSLIFASGSTYTVSVGGMSDSFTQSGTTYTPTEANGSALVQQGAIFTYTGRNGLVATFLLNSAGLPFWDATVARATGITFPDGTHVHFFHKIVQYCPGGESGDPPEVPLTCEPGYHYALRLQSITNNHGYQLKLGYASDLLDDRQPDTDYARWSLVTSVMAINNAVDYCSPTADSCTGLSQAWPTLSFTSGGATELTVTTPAGEATRFTYGPDGITGIRRPGAAADNVTVTYTAGKVSRTVIDGVRHDYAYADQGAVRTTTVAAFGGGTRVYTSDTATFRLTAFRDELNRTTLYDYDTSGRLIKATAPEGNQTRLAYDVRGNVTETRAVAKPGSGLADIVAAAAFPASCANPTTCNKPTSTTNPRGNTTDYAYDATHGGVLSVTLPAPAAGAVRPQTRYSYAPLQAYYKNASGAVVGSGAAIYLPASTSACQTGASCAGTADEAKTSLDWGPQSAGTPNNLLPVATSSGSGDGALTATIAAAWDNIGNLVSVDGPLAGSADTTTFRHDLDRRRIGTISPDPDAAGPLLRRAERVTIAASGNATGLVTRVEQGTVTGTSDAAWAAFAPLQSVDLSWDADARLVRRTLTGGGAVQAVTDLAYDDLGRLECTAVRMNPAAWGALADGCELQLQGSQGPDRIGRTVYDLAGQVLQSQSAFLTADQATEVTSTYRANGRLATLTDGEGNTTTYEYDGHDRLLKTRFPSPTVDGTSSTTDYEQLTYDAASNVTLFRERGGNGTYFTYDALNRVTLKNVANSPSDPAFTWDNLGRLTSQGWTGGMLTFSWDALSRNLTSGGPQGTTSFQYDLAGRRTRMTYPGAGLYIEYDYLLTGEVTRIRENGATSGIGVLAIYAYDNLGRRVSLVRGNGTSATYGYDNASRLSQLVENMAGTSHDLTLGFTYNPASQIVTNTRSNNLYSFTAHANESTASTINGLNQVVTNGGATLTHDNRGNMTNDGSKAYGYNLESMLTSAPGVTMTYDPALRLHQVTGASTRRFLYDGADAIGEYGPTNALERRYVHGPGVDEPLVWYEGTGTSDRRFLHADERGSIVAISNSTGAVTTVNTYDEYGRPGAANDGLFQYTGQKYIEEAGLYDYKARMYHPGLGRFMQADPIGYASEMNLYAYVRNDPINFVDPSGLIRWCVAEDRPYASRLRWFCHGTHDADRLGAALSSWRPSGDPSGRGAAQPSNPMNWPHGERLSPPPRDCQSAIDQVADMSSAFGLPFDDQTKVALNALALGGPSALRFTESGFAEVSAYVARNRGAVTSVGSTGNGLWEGRLNFGASAYGGSQESTRLGALLGVATLYFKGGPEGPLVGIHDVFDYDSDQAQFPASLGLRWANAALSARCPNRLQSVTISGGVTPR